MHDQLAETGVRGKVFIRRQDVAQMRSIAGMVERGEVRTFVDSVFSIERAEEASKRFGRAWLGIWRER